MSWLGEWLGNWIGNWFGQGQQQQQPATVPYVRYGRILSPATDRLFGVQVGNSRLCEVSSSAVILGRTDTDDYVRMRVPDTGCPPLPQPNWPLDSGVADFAEPDRWVDYGSPDTSAGWLVKQLTDQIQLAYSCYSGDFELEFEISDLSVLSGTVNGVIFDGIVIELKIDDNNWACVGFGFLAANNIRGFGWLRMAGGVQAYAIGPGVLSDEVFRARVARSGNSWSARFWRSGDPTWTTPSSLGNIGSGPVWIRVVGLRFSVGSGYGWWSNRNVQGRVRYLTTNFGAPDFIWVEAPVVDLGQPTKAEVRGLPSGTQLVWRAGNELPLPDYWDNPTGAYRYWQARLSTSSIVVLLERIEFVVGYLVLEAVWLRNRFIWLARTNKTPVVVPFRPVAWSHHVSSITQTQAGYEVTFSDAAEEYSLLLEER
jgi:hypothetical protein